MVQATESADAKESNPVLNAVCYPGFASLIPDARDLRDNSEYNPPEVFHVSLVDSDDVIEQITAAASHPRSATPFCPGLRIEVCTAVICSERMPACTSRRYF